MQLLPAVLHRFAQVRQRAGRRQKLRVDTAFLTYVGLRYFRNNAPRSQHLGTATASAREIAGVTGQDQRAVERNVPRLEAWGLVFRDPRPGSKTRFTFNDEPDQFLKDAVESGPERAKGIIEMQNERMRQKARSEAARDACRGKQPPTQVSAPPDTGVGLPMTPVSAPPDTSVGPVGPEKYEICEKERAPAGADAAPFLAKHAAKDHSNGNGQSLHEEKDQAGPRPTNSSPGAGAEPSNGDPDRADIIAMARGLARKKAMPGAALTPAEFERRRQELQRQARG